MADQHRDTSRPNEPIRRSQPDVSAQDPDNAATQRRVREDSDAIRAEAARVHDTTPPEVRDRTVGEIVDDANRRADR